MQSRGGSSTPSESDLRNMNITELAEESRQAWNSVKSRLPEDVISEIGPYFNVLTDANHVKKFAKQT